MALIDVVFVQYWFVCNASSTRWVERKPNAAALYSWFGYL